jgi:hypothetical protein
MEEVDPKERRPPEERERALMKVLPAVVSHVFARAPGYRRLPAGYLSPAPSCSQGAFTCWR